MSALVPFRALHLRSREQIDCASVSGISHTAHLRNRRLTFNPSTVLSLSSSLISAVLFSLACFRCLPRLLSSSLYRSLYTTLSSQTAFRYCSAPTMASPSAGQSSLVLVTGASGYLAGWIIVSLLARGYRVRGTLRSAAKEASTRAALAELAPAASDRQLVHFVHADLTIDDGSWDAAVAGCDYVLHVASDMGKADSKLSELIGPARDGTLRVVRAAIKARVKRIVVTSSCRVLYDSRLSRGTVTDTDWGDANDKKIGTYSQSKILAERAAWDEINQRGNGFTTMTAVLPSFIQGPIIGRVLSPSTQLVSRMLDGQVPLVPSLKLAIIDVRDCADLHVLAMTAPQAANQRYIGTNEALWMREVAECLKANLSAHESRLVSVRPLPDWVVRIAAWFSAEAAFVAKSLGKDIKYDPSKARNELGWKARPARQTIVDAARSLIQAGLVKTS